VLTFWFELKVLERYLQAEEYLIALGAEIFLRRSSAGSDQCKECRESTEYVAAEVSAGFLARYSIGEFC